VALAAPTLRAMTSVSRIWGWASRHERGGSVA